MRLCRYCVDCRCPENRDSICDHYWESPITGERVKTSCKNARLNPMHCGPEAREFSERAEPKPAPERTCETCAHWKETCLDHTGDMPCAAIVGRPHWTPKPSPSPAVEPIKCARCGILVHPKDAETGPWMAKVDAFCKPCAQIVNAPAVERCALCGKEPETGWNGIHHHCSNVDCRLCFVDAGIANNWNGLQQSIRARIDEAVKGEMERAERLRQIIDKKNEYIKLAQDCVHPWDILGIRSALHDALSADQEARHEN